MRKTALCVSYELASYYEIMIMVLDAFTSLGKYPTPQNAIGYFHGLVLYIYPHTTLNSTQ